MNIYKIDAPHPQLGTELIFSFLTFLPSYCQRLHRCLGPLPTTEDKNFIPHLSRRVLGLGTSQERSWGNTLCSAVNGQPPASRALLPVFSRASQPEYHIKSVSGSSSPHFSTLSDGYFLRKMERSDPEQYWKAVTSQSTQRESTFSKVPNVEVNPSPHLTRRAFSTTIFQNKSTHTSLF